MCRLKINNLLGGLFSKRTTKTVKRFDGLNRLYMEEEKFYVNDVIQSHEIIVHLAHGEYTKIKLL